MDALHPLTLAALTGLISGLLLSIPVGPVNLTIIHEGARRGLLHGLMIGVGATVMEVVYCAIAFTGFATFFSRGYVKAVMELTSFVFLLYLGIRFLVARNPARTPVLMAREQQFEERLERRLEEKLHPHTALMTGFVRVLANPGVLVFWIILAANFISREWVDVDFPGTRLACISGVAAGVMGWFAGLSWAVSYGGRRMQESTLLKLERGSGVVLLALAVAHGGHIVWQMARHKL
jgi:threonine/homoserine/homoserine lactone efflux protein